MIFFIFEGGFWLDEITHLLEFNLGGRFVSEPQKIALTNFLESFWYFDYCSTVSFPGLLFCLIDVRHHLLNSHVSSFHRVVWQFRRIGTYRKPILISLIIFFWSFSSSIWIGWEQEMTYLLTIRCGWATAYTSAPSMSLVSFSVLRFWVQHEWVKEITRQPLSFYQMHVVITQFHLFRQFPRPNSH